MGYYVDQIDSKFYMDSKFIPQAWEALKDLMRKEKKSIHDSSGYHYSWVDTDSVLRARSFKEAMSECRWELIEDALGNFSDICFGGEKYAEDMTIFLDAIAPYVEKGSYVVMQGEEGERWKWKFIDENTDESEILGHLVQKRIEEVSGETIFEDEALVLSRDKYDFYKDKDDSEIMYVVTKGHKMPDLYSYFKKK